MLTVGNIVWSVEHVPLAVKFWCKVLDYEPLGESASDSTGKSHSKTMVAEARG